MRPKWGPDSRVSLSVSENRDVSTKKGPVRDVCVSQKGCLWSLLWNLFGSGCGCG